MIIVKPVWRKPWFRDGYTEYKVIRKTTERWNAGRYNEYTTSSEVCLYKSRSIEDAIFVRDKMVAVGVQ